MSSLQDVLIVEGVRTPFLDSGGAYSEFMTYELGGLAYRGLLNKVGVDPKTIEAVTLGTVLHEVETSNVAREAMLHAGIPSSVPAYTTSMAGLSATVGFVTLCDQIRLGRVQAALAGGTESFSDIPLRLSPTLRKAAMKLRQKPKAKTVMQQLVKLRPVDLLPVMPTGTDFTTKKTMGVCAEAMVAQFELSRQACDEFTVRSHQRALRAREAGYLQAEIVPVKSLTENRWIEDDDTPRADCTLDRIAQQKPIFKAEGGVITAAGSSRFTDGAAAVLLCGEEFARAHALTPKARVVDAVFTGVESLEQHMLLGPAMAIPKLLARQGLKADEVDVWELHEAFAAQVLVNLSCLGRHDFYERFHGGVSTGAVQLDKVNAWGGSLSLGNPFAATGMRLITTACNRLKAENGRYAVVSSCAGGGLGAALLLENI